MTRNTSAHEWKSSNIKARVLTTRKLIYKMHRTTPLHNRSCRTMKSNNDYRNRRTKTRNKGGSCGMPKGTSYGNGHASGMGHVQDKFQEQGFGDALGNSEGVPPHIYRAPFPIRAHDNYLYAWKQFTNSQFSAAPAPGMQAWSKSETVFIWI